MIADDLTPFFVPGEFAGAEDTLDGVPVVGIFDAEYTKAGDGIGMASTRPAYTLPAAAIAGDPDGKRLVANGAAFIVESHEPDGTGIVVLYLGFE